MSRPTYASVDELLAAARCGLDRVGPVAACRAVAAGAWLVDIRPYAQRVREGEIPGSLVVERNHLEWRLHPASDAKLPVAAPSQEWIVFCSEGYTSSLAADGPGRHAGRAGLAVLPLARRRGLGLASCVRRVPALGLQDAMDEIS